MNDPPTPIESKFKTRTVTHLIEELRSRETSPVSKCE